MDSSVKFRCSVGELEAWRAAAGYEPLSSWARRVLNEASGSVMGVAVSARPSPSVVAGPAFTELLDEPFMPRSVVRSDFKPDFKRKWAGSSRLGGVLLKTLPVPEDEAGRLELGRMAASTLRRLFTQAEVDALFQSSMTATQKRIEYVDIVCRHCSKRQKAEAHLRDWSAAKDILKLYTELGYGKPTSAPEQPKPPAQVSLDLGLLSDEELVVLAAG